MTDLKQMMDSMPLVQCLAEISQQMESVSSHANEMKKAVLMLTITNEGLAQLKAINTDKFIEQLRDELKGAINQVDDWKLQKELLQEHLQRNVDLLKFFSSKKEEAKRACDEINDALAKFDNMLSTWVTDRAKKSIAELEADKKQQQE